MLDRITLDNIERLVEYFDTPNIRRRFVEKCSKLDNQQRAIVQDILKGIRISETPEHSEYLLEERPFLKVLSETLFEIPDAEESDNLGLHDALIFIEEHYRGDRIKYWRSLFSNKHVSAGDIRRIVDLEYRGGVTNVMTGFGTNLGSIAQLPNTPEDVLERFLDIEDVSLWKYTAKNDNCPESLLLYLLSHKKKRVRELVAQAPNATSGMLLTMLGDDEPSVLQAVCRRRLSIPAEVMLAMIIKNLALTAKQVKELLLKHAEFSWLELGVNNRKHLKLFSNARKKCAREYTQEELMSLYYLMRKDALHGIQIPDTEKDDEIGAKELSLRYRDNPKVWRSIVKDRRCSDELLKQMFLDGYDISNNPTIYQRMNADMNYMSRLFPRSKKERLVIAKNNQSSNVLHNLFLREHYAKTPNMDVLIQLCLNSNTDKGTLDWIYDEFNLKEVSMNPNCPMELRKRILQN